MNHDILSTFGITILALMALAASVLALCHLFCWGKRDPTGLVQHRLLWVCAVGSGVIFLYRAMALHGGWRPDAYVDGLLLIAALFAGTLIFLQSPSRVPGIGAFGLPILTLLLTWAICAGWWTFHPFGALGVQSVWLTVHLGALFTGTAFIAVAASAGVMYLFVDRRLRTKRDALAEGNPRLASLEAVEKLVVRTSALGFAVLTLGLATGLVLISVGESGMGAGWWYSPKVLLGGAVWLIYALVMNARHAATFRGKRAAWLSIAGLVLLLVTWGITTKLPGAGDKQSFSQTGGRERGIGRGAWHQEAAPCDS